MNLKKKLRLKFIAVIMLALLAGLIAYPRAIKKVPPVYNTLNKLKIRLGLDLQGGIHLEYKADLSQIEAGKKKEAMQALQDVIERRVNAFGVAEPVIYTTKSGSEERLVVELAGIKDIDQAKAMIKETPFLEFKEEDPNQKTDKIPQDVLDKMNAKAKVKAEDILKKVLAGADFGKLAKENSEDPGSKEKGGDLGFVKKGVFVPAFDKVLFDDSFKDGTIYSKLVESPFGWHIIKKIKTKKEGGKVEVHSAHILIAKHKQPIIQKKYISTGLNGKNLEGASLEFQNQGLSEPQVALQFDSQGAKLFADITKKNIKKQVAIYLDGKIVSAPTVQAEIDNGQAVISGHFTLQEAKNLVKNLNEGALPVPISLVSQHSVQASLGKISLVKSVKAGAIGLVIVIIFMIIYYRFLGLIASMALLIYTALMVAIFKLSTLTPWSITFTLSGIAGFILSIGMAVDANVLIFERTKEEIKNGRSVVKAIEEGFHRAWPSIRDGNYSTIITSLILIGIGTGFVKGFAIILVIGVLVSMFTAIVLVKITLTFLSGDWMEKRPGLIITTKPKINHKE